MHSWTTRTAKVAIMAAGFATAGAGAANAAGTSDIQKPDLSAVPDTINAEVPANACQMQEGAAFSPTKAPCVDAQLGANSPNVIKQVGADITKTAHGTTGELKDGRQLLAPGKPNRALGHVFAETTRLSKMAKTRPTVSGSVQPEHVGVVHEHTDSASLLDFKVGPRQPSREGFSAADTAVAATAAQGYENGPIADRAGLLMPTLENNPLQTSREPVTLAKPSDVLPAAANAPVLGKVDKTVSSVANSPVQHVGQTLTS